MLKFGKTYLARKKEKPMYTICANCKHYRGEIFDLLNLFTDIPAKCYAKTTLEKRFDFVTGEKENYLEGPLENCNEKNAGACPDFEKKRAWFHC